MKNTTDQLPAHYIKYDLCARCSMRRTDRHHSATYKMARSPYDIPRHTFMAVAR